MSLPAQVYTNRRSDAYSAVSTLQRTPRNDVKGLTQNGLETICDQQNVCDGRGVVLGFALQEAARAAQVLASLTSFRSCLRLEYVLGGEAYLSKRFCTGRARRAALRHKRNDQL